jgi:hypothetical protein
MPVKFHSEPIKSIVADAYQTAITDYYEAARQLPQSLDDLVEDKRWPKPRHFLRRPYADPMTGQVRIGRWRSNVTPVAVN